MEKVFVGIDVGSTGCKSIAITGTGAVVARCSIRYDQSIIGLGQGAYEQNPEILLNSAIRCIKNLVSSLQKRYEVAAISFTGQMHGLVALGRDGKPIRPIISCVDFRNMEENKAIYDAVGGESGLVPFTNNKMVASCTGGKIKWMQTHEPELYSRIWKIINPKDYVRTVLCGVPVTDESDASGFGLYDVKNHCWSEPLLETIGIEKEILPDVVLSSKVVGTILPEYAELLHVSPETKIVAGAGDAIMQSVGSGAVTDGTYSVILGSGGLISTSLHTFVQNEGARLQVYSSALENQWVAYVGLMAVGNAVNWFCEKWYGHEASLDMSQAFEAMQREAGEVAPGADGLLFFPSILGQRNPVEDPFAKGVLIGLTPAHTRGHMARALLEGLAMGMMDVYLQLKQVASPLKEIRLSGGGAVNELWCQIFADVFGVPVHRVQEYSICGAMGAAMIAACSDKHAEDIQKFFTSSPVDVTYLPSQGSRAVYADMFRIYQNIYPSNASIFKELKHFDDKYGVAGGAL